MDMDDVNTMLLIHIAAFYVSINLTLLFDRGYLEQLKSVIIYSIYFLVGITMMVFMSRPLYSPDRPWFRLSAEWALGLSRFLHYQILLPALSNPQIFA